MAAPGAVFLSSPSNTVGEWLSLVEHLVRDQGVGGSNPLSPTKQTFRGNHTPLLIFWALMYMTSSRNLGFTSSWVSLLILLLVPASLGARGTENVSDPAATFRWIHPASAPQLWQQIQDAFHDELAPDEAKRGQDELDVYR